MPLQNRVDPFGQIHAVAERGLFTGNRGVIHDPATRTLLKRRWTAKAWIVCDCDFGGRRREVMGRNAPSGNAGWTELFFLDEPTALAAGHRPCFYCRREKAREFADCFGAAFGIARPKAAEMDERLHRERLASGGRVSPLSGAVAGLPDGVVLERDRHAHALHGGGLLPWTFAGYLGAAALPASRLDDWRIVTPPTTVAVLAAGYRPVWHPSADPARIP